MGTTYDTLPETEERAILVSLVTGEARKESELAEYSLKELVNLAETAGVQVLERITQNKESVDPKWFIGKGKVEELRSLIAGTGANTAIFDQELSGAQVRNLEEALDVKIIDRTQLILDIFAKRARTREGNIQVELAQLNYLLPRLSGHGKNLSRLGGGIGTRGPGETKLETDRRHIRHRISELKAHLDEVVRHRSLHRERRKKTGIFQVALVGYTNAGKSTLLRQLTGADVLVENQLFATLDPTSRQLELPSGKEILLTDTVGFIQNLPHALVAAFRATLEEVNEADLVLHVVDTSSPMRDTQIHVVHEVLGELGAQGKDMITLYNKIDLCPPEELELLPGGDDVLKISAYREGDLIRLKDIIQSKVMGDTRTYRIPAERGDLISMAYRIGDVLDQDADEEAILLKVRVHKDEFEKLGYKLKDYEAEAPAPVGEADGSEAAFAARAAEAPVSAEGAELGRLDNDSL